MRKIPGIYTITIPTGEFYLGSSVNTYMRKHQHWNCLKMGTHNNAPLIAAYEKYGKDGLKFEVIFSLFPGVNTLEVEQEFLDELSPPLNITLLSHSPMRDPVVAAKTAKTLREGKQYIDQLNSIRHLAHKASSKAVVRVTDGMRFDSGRDAARFMGYTKRIGDIASTIRHQTRCKSGHFWVLEGSNETLESLEKREAQKKRNMKTSAKSVIRLTDGKVYDMAQQAADEHGLTTGGAICSAIKRGGKAAGHYWAFVKVEDRGNP